ncbi:MAG: hypothetical protein IPQ08_08195 [Chitinophagaceae bacterium]|nr:hypothetical protein [Chitinophagaceae bacterium]
MRFSFLIILITGLFWVSCKKDSFISSPEARLIVTADTLKYDTVFVSAGSTYRQFRVINDNDQKLRISSLRLMGGASSVFKMNLDGVSGTEFTNLELAAHDSLYVFMQVNVDPSAINQPFVLRDSVRISYNGKTSWVQLEAWGQNAHFLRDHIVNSSETWNNDKPYVILGSLLVNTNQTLTINKGCRIYMHADAPFIVDGTLQVNGLKDTIDRVVFSGDRLDEPFKDYPASWPGIYFLSNAKNNQVNFAMIRNAYQSLGVIDPSVNANPKLVLNETIIDNGYDAGIISSNSSIQARNCLISNCGKNLLLTKGGNYQFTHCTVASYSNRFISHKEPVVQLTNFGYNNNTPVSNNLTAVFRNCIFWGETGLVTDEVVVIKNGNTLFNVLFDYGIWKAGTTPANVTSNQMLNQNPLFENLDPFNNGYNFHLSSSSPALNKGTNAGVILDLDGKPRPVGLPDLGCFEKQ